MSRPQPRPSAAGARKPAGGPPSKPGRQGPSIEELRNLPMFVDDGTNADYSSENVSSGKITDETVTIGAARVRIQDWKKLDGTYATRKDGSACYPEVQLELGLRRDGHEDGDKLYTVGLKYAYVSSFAPSKDGNFLRVRPSAIKEGAPAPKFRKYDPGVMFLNSIEIAGGKSIIDRIKTEGYKALIGLRVHVREQRVTGMPEKQPDVLLVDYFDNGEVPTAQQSEVPTAQAAKVTTKPAQTAQVAPVAVHAETDSSDIVTALATEALVDILSAAADKTVVRAQIPTTLIRIDKWKTHEQRGAILKKLREDGFINGSDKWIVDDTDPAKTVIVLA